MGEIVDKPYYGVLMVHKKRKKAWRRGSVMYRNANGDIFVREDKFSIIAETTNSCVLAMQKTRIKPFLTLD